jgi:[ribosomal protein S5]-alanine N-acetyltransferase
MQTRYRLVPLTIDDQAGLGDICRWQGGETQRDRFCFQPVGNHVIPFTESRFDHFCKAMESELEERAYFLLVSTDTGSGLGYITLSDYNCRNHTAEISYYLPPENRGQGLGSVMLGLLLEIAFDESRPERIDRLWAETAAFNAPSAHMLEKYGFRRDGCIREHYWLGGERFDQWIYTLLRAEYVSPRD